MNSSRGFFRRAHAFQHQFKNTQRSAQASAFMQSYSLACAKNTIYSNQLRMQSTMLVPLNARLAMLNGVAIEEEDSEVAIIDDSEDDTL